MSASQQTKEGSPPKLTSPTTPASTNASFGSPYVQDVSCSVYPLQQHLNEEEVFPDNSIKTSRYTILTFVPMNLFEQFRKVSNFYFLITAIISSIPGASPVSPLANIMPLIFVVSVSMVKDGWEDFQRHRADDKANSIEATCLKQGDVKLSKVKSRDIAVGDILFISYNEEIRADCVLLNTSHPEGMAYIDTASLDGESSLKSKKSKQCTMEHLGSIDALIKATQPELMARRREAAAEEREAQRKEDEKEAGEKADSHNEPLSNRGTPKDGNEYSEAEGPTPHRRGQPGMVPTPSNSGTPMEGSARDPVTDEAPEAESPFPALVMGSPPHPNLDAWKGQVRLGGTPYPLGIDQFLYRGAVLRNTDWALGLVQYAGVDTKMFLNLKQKPSKFSSLDVKMNYLIATVFFVNQILVLLLCSLSVDWWAMANAAGPKGNTGRRGYWYVQPDLDFFSGVSLFFWYYLGYFVLLSYMIPVSLFVTMEINKASQAGFMMFDQTMMHWDERLREWRHCKPRTSSINEQLALVQFIFTDKTGTLTENVMKYVGGLIGEKDYSVNRDGPKSLGGVAAAGRADAHTARAKSANPGQPPVARLLAPALVVPRFVGGSEPVAGGGSGDFKMEDPVHTREPTRQDDEFQIPQGGGVQLEEPRDLHENDEDYPDYLDDLPSLYLMALATCHGVICFKEGNEIVYDGQSPDEIAFVEAAKHNGFILTQRNSSSMEVEIEGDEYSRTFEILAELEFDANRKMMSMLLKDVDTDVNILFTKGADSSIIAHMADSEHNKEYVPRLDDNLKELGSVGYRTLLIGCRVVSENEAETFRAAFEKASVSMGDRDAELREVFKTIEHSLELIGSTGVEDKLQDEVPETIEFCLNAKMVVWMLTGDKRETAVTIAATSRLLHPQKQHVAHCDTSMMNHTTEAAMLLVATSAYQQIQDALKYAKQEDTVLVIDGKTLSTVLSEEINQVEEFSKMLDTFIELGFCVVSGVCCRLTPLQKAEIVKMFQEKTQATALAIGDGANDVSMIMEGKVGIGIMGREGSQAELAADYAIPKFKHLKRLLFVHGRDCFYRNTGCITFSLYKNMALAITLSLYGFYSAYTGLPLYESWVLSMYNTIFCMLPPTFFGMCDRDVSPEVALKYPYIFPPIAKTWQYFNATEFFLWIADCTTHGFFIFWMGWSVMGGQNDFAGDNASLDWHGHYIYIPLVILINLRMSLFVKTWTWFQVLGIASSIGILFLFMTLYNLLDYSGEYKGNFFDAMGEVKVYLFIFLVDAGLLMTFNATRDYIRNTEFPLWTIVANNTEAREQKELGQDEEMNKIQKVSTPKKKRDLILDAEFGEVVDEMPQFNRAQEGPRSPGRGDHYGSGKKS